MLPVRVAIVTLVLATLAAAADPFDSGAVEVVDLDGGSHLVDREEGTTTVIVFLSPGCPISRAVVPRLRELAEEWMPAAADGAPRVRFLALLVPGGVPPEGAAAAFRDRPLPFPVVAEGADELRRRLGPTHVPEAFVVDADGRIAYRGAIDDEYEAVGRRRPEVTRRWLADAIGAIATGGVPPRAFVPPVGCVLEGATAGRPAADVTYARDVAPVLHSACVSCHRPGEVAPFPLTDFEEVSAHAPMIAETVRARIMPPWMPEPNPRHPFLGERRLSEDEIGIIEAWVAAGCPRGDPDDEPPLPRFAPGWQLGEPDLVLRMPEPFVVPAEGPDIHRHFVLPVDIPEDKVVAAAEFRPGDRRVVHHAVLFLDRTGAARRLDAAAPGPGYDGFGGPGFLPSGALGGWSPGNTPRRLAGGRGRHLARGSDLVVQIHYHPDGVERVDRSEIGLFFLDEPTADVVAAGDRLVGSVWTSAYEIDIPAGEAAWRTSADYTLPKEVTVVGIVPHMHLLGRAVSVRAELPDGSTEPLVDILDWNHAWQDEYAFAEPFRLPAGTRIVTEGTFDNSEANPSNPSKPPRRVAWGEGTRDEMLFAFLLISAERTEDLVNVILDNLGHDLRAPRRRR